ncbi:MAG: hypothetical protein HQ518_21855 [Rhodopirellula sp.]|nr:hypothetical protein [Rhodopirellula sp.]
MAKKEEKPAICYETGLDESFLVGTKEELLDFANSIIHLLNIPAQECDYHGVNTEQPKVVYSLTEPMSDIVIDGIVIVESKDDRRDLINKMRINNDEVPIDWEGHDNWYDTMQQQQNAEDAKKPRP